MSITRNRMCVTLAALGMLGAGLAFADRTDYSPFPYAESFEDLTAWGGVFTNISCSNGWYSTGNDLSVITNVVPYDLSTFTACTLPLSSATHTNFLKLDTEGATLTNNFNNVNLDPGGSGGPPIYMDAMVMFVPNEDIPASLTPDNRDIKTAIFADVNTNLNIYVGVAKSDGSALQSNIVVATSTFLAPTNWYRLTIEFDPSYGSPGQQWDLFQVRINGQPIHSSSAYDSDWQTYAHANSDCLPVNPSPTGTWFISAMGPGAANARILRTIEFQGTGYIDDLVVTNGDVSYVASLGSYTLTVVCGANGSSSLGGTNAFTQVPIAANSFTTIVYTANDWYSIQTLTSNSITVASNVTSYTQVLTNIAADVSNNVTFWQLGSASNYNAAFSNVTTAYMAQWGQASSNAVFNNSSLTLYQQYLLNINPYVDETNNFTVSAINVTQGTNIAVTVGLQINSANHTNIIGTLSVEAIASLTNTSWSVVSGTPLTGNVFTNGTHTYNFVDTVSNRFYKAIIE